MDKVILTSISLEELAEAVFQKFSALHNNTIETSSNDTEKQEDTYLTREETAKFCKLKSLSTLWNWQHKGKLVPSANSGRKPLYLRSDVIAYLTKQNSTK